MKSLAATLAVTLCLAGTAHADEAQDKAAVVAVVDRFFTAMSAHDDKTWSELWLPDSIATSQNIQPDGAAKLRRVPIKEMIANLPGGPAMSEHMWTPTVTLRGPIAVVWAPYEFKLDGKRHHCGIDVFDLVKVDGAWKLASAMWTSEPTACEALGAKN